METIVMGNNKYLKLRIIAFTVLLILTYTILSADCAFGGSCTVANGDWFNWIATTLSK
jgi:hypothetical protein